MSSPIQDWKYYNHAAVSAIAPHKVPSLIPLKDGSIWRINGKKPLLVRYTTDWDCATETNWWYVIKDTPFDISALKTKRRYEITKALRFFDVKEINPLNYSEALAEVQMRAFEAYPAKYRPVFEKSAFMESLNVWQRQTESGLLKVFGAFFKDTSELAGYSYIVINETYLNFAVQKTNPKFEKYNVNAALVYGVLECFHDKLSSNYYICDGARAINHESRFQDYLEKYFGFRKAFCQLHLAYPPMVKLVISLSFPFRRIIGFFGRRFGLAHHLFALLRMEEIAKKSRK